MPAFEKIRDAWAAQWPQALALWSKFTKLREPVWCFTAKRAAAEGLVGSFAMIRFNDQRIVLDLEEIVEKGLEDYALEIMAHEIGHHVYCPADLTDQGRTVARMRRALPTKEKYAPLIANLYQDLLINDRLQRSAELRMAEVFAKLVGEGETGHLWTLYMRIYEILWSLPRARLARGALDAMTEGDAQLGARLIRVYAKDWLKGAGRFAALCLPYLLKDAEESAEKMAQGWLDTNNAGAGGAPDGLVEIDPDEFDGAIHPSQDKRLTGLDYGPADGPAEIGQIAAPKEGGANSAAGGQCREPFEYGEILKSLGLNLSDHEIAVRYYRERAIPHLVRFPVRVIPDTPEPLAEGLEQWDIGGKLEDVDWLETSIASPVIVPGLTTVQRVYGTTQGAQPEREPVDLDLYVDCSGSMPNPQRNTSYLTLAGAIITLSALRAGARVKATLWSGAHDFQTNGEFTRDETAVLQILTGYIGGATAFPIHLLRETFKNRTAKDRAVHILVISDDGVDTMFDADEQGNSGWDISRLALEKGRGGGTMVLNLYSDWQNIPKLQQAHEQGWSLNRVQTWEDLVEFARKFSRENYEK
jgi:hypothetical protein